MVKNWSILLNYLYIYLFELQHKKYLLSRWNNDLGYKRKYGFNHELSHVNAINLTNKINEVFKYRSLIKKFAYIKQNFKINTQQVLTALNYSSVYSFIISFKNKKLVNKVLKFKVSKLIILKKFKKTFNLFCEQYTNSIKNMYYIDTPTIKNEDLKNARRRLRFSKKMRAAKFSFFSTLAIQGQYIKKRGFFNVKKRAKNYIPIRHTIRSFYSYLSQKKILKYIKHKRKGDRIGNFITRLEQRIDIILIRYNIVPTIWLSKKLIQLGAVFIDHKCITNINYIVPIGSLTYLKISELSKIKLKSFFALMSIFENTKTKMYKRRLNQLKGPYHEHSETFKNISQQNIDKNKRYAEIFKIIQKIAIIKNIFIFKPKISNTLYKIPNIFFTKMYKFYMDKKTRFFKTIYSTKHFEENIMEILTNRWLQINTFISKICKLKIDCKILQKTINYPFFGGIFFQTIQTTDKMIQKKYIINMMTMARIQLKAYIFNK